MAAETDREAERRALVESEQRFRAIAAQLSDVLFITDERGVITYLSPSSARVFGYEPDEMQGRHFSAFLADADRAVALTAFRAAMSERVPTVNLQLSMKRASGDMFVGELSGSAVIADGVLTGTLGVIRDITDRIRAEERLKASESSYRGLFNTIKQAIYVQDAQGTFIDVNDGAVEMYGYSREELIGRNPEFVAAPGRNDVAAVAEKITRAFAGEPQQFEFWGRRKNGEVFPKDVRVYKGKYFGRDVLIAIAVDITERRSADEALRESEARYRVLFEGISDAVFVTEITDAGETGRFLQVNDVACRRLGYTRDELLALTPRDITPPTEFRRAARERQMLIDNGAALFETVHVSKDGRHIPVESNVHVIKYLGRRAAMSISRDITARRLAEEERLEMERRVQHVQKLESLGVLAGGIAHDFNNILVAILGNTELALMDLPVESPARDSLAEVEKAARRAGDLCRQMLAYSGRGRFVIEPIDLDELVTDIVHLLKVSISKRASLTLSLSRDLPAIEGDATQVRQVLMNLITNASDAIGDQDGAIVISTGVQNGGEGQAARVVAGDLRDVRYVYLEVADTGCGMSDETLSRVFDPFFSTKFTGRGLGMAAVLGIVRGHRGAIAIDTAVDRGTVFRVLFPALEHESAPAERPADGEAESWAGGGRVLLVDDEEVVRDLGLKMLERMGCEVLTAADGRTALALFEARRSAIDLVLLDLTMPRMDGEETYQELRRIDPGVPVVLTSGYTQQEVTARFAGQGLAGFVQKPFSSAELSACIGRALKRRRLQAGLSEPRKPDGDPSPA